MKFWNNLDRTRSNIGAETVRNSSRIVEDFMIYSVISYLLVLCSLKDKVQSMQQSVIRARLYLLILINVLIGSFEKEVISKLFLEQPG